MLIVKKDYYRYLNSSYSYYGSPELNAVFNGNGLHFEAARNLSRVLSARARLSCSTGASGPFDDRRLRTATSGARFFSFVFFLALFHKLNEENKNVWYGIAFKILNPNLYNTGLLKTNLL